MLQGCRCSVYSVFSEFQLTTEYTEIPNGDPKEVGDVYEVGKKVMKNWLESTKQEMPMPNAGPIRGL